MKQQKEHVVNTRLTTEQYQRVLEFAEREDRNVSQALRKIIAEWAELKQKNDHKDTTP